MEDSASSKTPEEGGSDNNAVTNSTSNEQQPQQELNPPKPKKRKKTLLSKTEWSAFSGELFVILWIWSDLVGTSSLNRLIFLCIALFVAHGVLSVFLSKLLKSWRWAILIWVALTVASICAAYKSSGKELAAQSSSVSPWPKVAVPDLKFWLHVVGRTIELTNDFLIVTNFNQGFRNPINGCIFIPTLENISNVNMNIPLSIGISNGSPSVEANDVRLYALFTDGFNFSAPDWLAVEPNNEWARIMYSFGNLPLLPGDTFKTASPIFLTGVKNRGFVQLMARAKPPSPTYSVLFELTFIGFPTNSPYRATLTNPVVVDMKHKNLVIDFDELIKLQQK
jgi:hypothetical protein